MTKERIVVRDSKDSLVLEVPREALFSAGWGSRRRKGVFVAYRFDDADSTRFRTDLEEAIHRQPGLESVAVLDGRVPAGFSWPREVRRRLKLSSLVVADLTNARQEVIFEAGLACGGGLPVITATRWNDDRRSVPAWLHELQFRPFNDALAVARIVEDIDEHLSNQAPVGALRIARVVPQRATLIGDGDWCRDSWELCERQLTERGLTVEVIRPQAAGPDRADVAWKVVERAAGSAVLVVFLDGREGSVLAHFVAGAVAAKSVAAPGRARLDRKIIAITPEGVAPNRLVAGGLSRCDESLISVVSAGEREELHRALEGAAKSFITWRQRAAKAQPFLIANGDA